MMQDTKRSERALLVGVVTRDQRRAKVEDYL